jgi:hypothetical protein
MLLVLFSSLSLSKVAQTVTVLTSIQKVLCLNLVWNTNYPEGGFFSAPTMQMPGFSKATLGLLSCIQTNYSNTELMLPIL